MLRNVLATLVIAVAGGFVFAQIHLPLPWLLGPVTATFVQGRFRPDAVCWPQAMRNAGLMVLGYTIGRPFTAEVGLFIIAQLPLMLAMALVLVLSSLAAGYVTHRQTGLSLATTVLATVPGGLSQMVTLSEEIAGADVAVVTLMQTIRMLSVVFTVPFLAIHGLSATVAQPSSVFQAGPAGFDMSAFLPFVAAVIAGAWVSDRLRLPTPFLLGPVLATAPLVVGGLAAPDVPPLLLIVAQIAIGTYIGANINFAQIDGWRKIFFATLLNVIVLLLLSLLIGYFLARAIPASLVTAFLSAAPGGMTEMGLTAIIAGADVSVVVGYNMFRLLFILLVLPFFLRYWLKER